MRRLLGLFYFTFMVIGTASVAFPADLNFGSRNSTIKASGTATLHVGSALGVDGTIAMDSGAHLTGAGISFDGGILERNDNEIFTNALLNPATSVINLTGGKFIKCEPGTVLQTVSVSSTGNSIEGQPLFSHAITLAAAAALTLAIQNALNMDINLGAGSTLTLGDNLALVDDVKIVGPASGTGTVNLNNRELTLGGYYSSAWSEDLTFAHATNINLTGNTELTGTWTFSDTSRINGHGVILDLSGGGTIKIAAGQKLYLEDIVIKGIGVARGDTHGIFEFVGADSELHLSNVSISLDGDFTMTKGLVFVEGTDTTFILRGNDWTFNTDAKLTVDGVTLWLDTLDRAQYADQGSLNAPAAVYDAHGYNASNVGQDVALGNLILDHSGVIKEVADVSTAISPTESYVLGGDVHGTITLNRDLTLRYDQKIEISGDTTIDGNGAVITFTNGVEQLIVPAGVTLTLRNITLANISTRTVDLRVDSQTKPTSYGKVLIDGPDVTFIVNRSLYLNSGIIELNGDLGESVLTVKGQNRQAEISFDDKKITSPGGTTITTPVKGTFVMNSNTLRLENCYLWWLHNITFNQITATTPDAIEGLIELAGKAGVDFDDSGMDGRTINMNFYVDGVDNQIGIYTDGLIYDGTIIFGESSLNRLTISFALEDPIVGDRRLTDLTTLTNAAPLLQIGTQKELTFNADGTIDLNTAKDTANIILGGTTGTGTSELIFDSPEINLDIANTAAFLIDSRSHLIYKKLNVAPNSIKKISADNIVIECAIATEGQQFAEPDWVRARVKPAVKPQAKPKPQVKPQAKPVKPVKPTKPAKPAKPGTTRSLEEAFNDETAQIVRSVLAQDMLPVTWAREIRNNETAVLADASLLSGSVKMGIRSVVSNFRTQAADLTYTPLWLFMTGDSRLELANVDVVLDPATVVDTPTAGTVQGNIFNIQGTGNVIAVKKTFTFKNQILMDPAAELTFEFANKDSQVIFDTSGLMTLEKNAKLHFKGPGKVVFKNLSNIAMNGTRVVVDAKLGVLYGTDMPLLSFEDGAQCEVPLGAATSITGVGQLRFDNASLLIPGPGSLSIGLDLTNFFDVSFDHSSLVYVGWLVDSTDISTYVTALTPTQLSSYLGNARLIFAPCGLTLSVKNNSNVIIEKNGRVENNSVGTGACSLLSWLGGGALRVKTGGRFVLGPNMRPQYYNEVKVAWNGFNSTNLLGGSGYVEFIGTTGQEPFTGKLSVLDSHLTADSVGDNAITFETLSKWLVQQMPTLVSSVLYIGTDGNYWIRTKTGAKVQLKPGDSITSDDAAGKISGIDSDRNLFSISKDGFRN